jgi:DNA topoisomerase-1
MPGPIELEIIKRENTTTAPAKLNIGTARFTASARKLLFNGYLALYSPEETALPPLKEQDELKLVNLTPAQSFTQPPPRYTEASLVKALEKFGIGRPSTYAPIISTIQSRGYVRRPRRSRQLFATELGILVTDKLQKFFEDVMDTGFTAQMEENLDKVEEAQTDWLKLLKDFYGIFSKDLAYAEGAMEKEKGAFADDGAKCEKCGSPMIIRWSRHGRFLACSAFPKCRTIKSLKPPASETIDQTQPPPLEPPFGDAHLTTENNSTEDTESTETTE